MNVRFNQLQCFVSWYFDIMIKSKGPIFFLSYVFLVFFVLLNMFIAIINDTYAEIKEELANEKSEIELSSFLKKGYDKVLDKLSLKKAQIVDIQKVILF